MKPKYFLALVLILTLSVCGTLFSCADVGNPGGEVNESEIENININIDTGEDIMREDNLIDRRIVIENGEFNAGGKKIWFNGVNTPWHKWNDFGGGYDDFWWNEHFKALRENGVNSVRVWINCNNDNGAIIINDAGMVTGASQKHWADLDKFFETAERNGIYIMATLLSFDHFKSGSAQRWRDMLASDETADSFAENYVTPFRKIYPSPPSVFETRRLSCRHHL